MKEKPVDKLVKSFIHGEGSRLEALREYIHPVLATAWIPGYTLNRANRAIGSSRTNNTLETFANEAMKILIWSYPVNNLYNLIF